MTDTAYNAWRLVSLSPLPGWALVALALALAVGVALALQGLAREPSRRRRLLLTSLRAAAAVAALFFLLEPGLRRLQVAQVKNRVAVLLDRSASMAFPVEPNGPSRMAEVAGYLQKVGPQLERLKDRFQIDFFGFDPELAPLTLEQLSNPPRGGRTDLVTALREVKALEQGAGAKKLSGILLFSDGADNAELAAGAVGKARSTLEALGVPVSTFLAGKEGLKDLAIEQVRGDDFAFVRNSVTVEVEVRGRGFANQTVPVTLRRESQVIATSAVTLRSPDDVQTVTFTFTPDQTGRFVYLVSVPVFADEAVTDNNVRSFALKVIRDRVRVLLVVGRPSWDERFLRGLLKQDPNIDLVSFYILRTMTDDPLVHNPDRELSLIPFPMDEIFDTKLDTFDVVIFQNFGYTDPQLSISNYESNLERYVKNGGAFVMVGGDHAFGEGRALWPTLMQALPVDTSGIPASVELVRPRLTADGLRHPITAVATGASSNEASWQRMPPLPGANLTRAKPGATVLLDHPFQNVDGKSAPLLAIWEYGRGRSMTVALDSTWYWAFTAHQGGVPTRHYDRFWGNALRWLVRDPDLTTLKLTADPPAVEPGRPVGALLSVRTPDYQPAPGAEVRVELYSIQEQKVIAVQAATTGVDGEARVEFAPPAPGAYKLLGTAKKGEQSLGAAEDAVAVRAVGRELSDAAVHPQLMRQIADATGGRAYRLPLSGLPDVPLLDPPVVEVGRSKDQPLWDRWYYLVALVVLLGTEWLLRRRFGYI